MDASSGTDNSSSDQEPVPKVWRCIHCQATGPGMKPGFVPKFCFECGAAQIKCINPKCNKLLFSDKAEFCHECHTPQQPQRTNGSGGTKDSDPDKGNPGVGGKKDDKPDERLSGDNTKPTKSPDSPPATAVQQSPGGDTGPVHQQQPGKGDNEVKLDEDETLQKLKTDQSETETTQTKPQRRSLTLDSEESSEEEEYHTPSPGKDKEEAKSKGATGDRLSNNSMKDVSQIDKPLTRLSLRERRKHERDESIGDSELNPTKKKALGDEKPPLSPSARDSATLDSDEEKDGEKQKDQTVKGDRQQERIKSEVNKHPLQEDSTSETMEVPRIIQFMLGYSFDKILY